jgi:hypothetical protein
METTMKSFKEYLTESKKVYEFKIKIAGDLPPGFEKDVKSGLDQFDVQSISKPKRTPIQESPIDFPNVKFSEVSVFEVALNYPTTSQVVKEALAQAIRVSESKILVRTLGEEAEAVLNASSMRVPGGNKSLLNTPELEQIPGAQELVGEKRAMSFLKDLNTTKHDLEEVTGTNDQLFVKSKKETAQPQQEHIEKASKSPVSGVKGKAK